MSLIKSSASISYPSWNKIAELGMSPKSGSWNTKAIVTNDISPYTIVAGVPAKGMPI
ncbi:MAG: hypothetical protein WCQ70_04335 [Lentimicrobiaceae bacterium]